MAWELQSNADLSIPVANNDTKTIDTPPPDPMAYVENSRFTAFTEQPLFRPDRQPLDWALINRSNAADQQKSSTDIEKRYQLQGVSISTPEQVALIFDTVSGEILTLNINENLSGWTLRLVDKHSVTFVRQAHKLQLFLSPPDNPQKIPGDKIIVIQQSKPLKTISGVPEDDPYQ
ncbi:MAG TPA: hypothetical protein VK999_03405 [Methylotenera sp.]|nr:hypothetical protein [Methylotenera sp.]